MHRSSSGDKGLRQSHATHRRHHDARACPMPNVLFIKTSSLGDVIHHMPAVTEASQQRPDARFTWVVEEAFAPLVALHPAVAEVIPVASRRWRHALPRPATWREIRRCIKRIRMRDYQDVIDTQGLLRSAVITKLARGRRHGYDASSIREPTASLFYDIHHRVARDLHAIARNRALTGSALGYKPSGAIDFGLERSKLLGPPRRPYALLLHATARHEKEWPEQSWIAVGRALVACGLELALPWGTEGERLRSERLAAQLVNAQVPARRPLDEAAQMIAGASLVVGVDTGLVHLAAAFGVPLVAIFASSEPGLTGPVGPGPIAIIDGKGKAPHHADVIVTISKLVDRI
jgi:heptosyltransferase I